ncbi:MAG: ribosome maturation factor RimP [Sporichthyaceae bacterium]
MGASAEADRVRSVLEPVLAETGVDLEQVEVAPAGRRRVLRIVVDRDGGIDLDAVADVSRTVSAALDEAETMGETPYVLEVTSPGVDRPLTRPAHWRRASGRLVRAVLKDGSTLTGRVRDADDAGADLVLVERGESRRLDFGQIARAHVQIEFAPAGADED